MSETQQQMVANLVAARQLTERWAAEIQKEIAGLERDLHEVEQTKRVLNGLIHGIEQRTKFPDFSQLLALAEMAPGADESNTAFDTDTVEGVSVREAVLTMLASEDRPFKTSEIVDRIGEFGAEAQPDSTRSVVSKLHHSGFIEQVKRGVYRLPSGTSEIARQTLPSRAWLVEDKPTAEEFMAMAPDPEEEMNEETRPELTHAQYVQMNFEAEQAHLEEQSDREETSS